MSDNGLPCLDLLEATPRIIRDLMCELSQEDAHWKPAPGRFSVAEVLAHHILWRTVYLSESFTMECSLNWPTTWVSSSRDWPSR